MYKPMAHHVCLRQSLLSAAAYRHVMPSHFARWAADDRDGAGRLRIGSAVASCPLPTTVTGPMIARQPPQESQTL
jgi:hypothetical protein